MGPVHLGSGCWPEERPQPVSRRSAYGRGPDRHAAQPAVRRRASSPSPCRGCSCRRRCRSTQRRQRGRVPDQLGRAQRQAALLPQRLQRPIRRQPVRQPTTRSATRSPTAGRWRAVRPESSSRISAGTSSSPRSATSCRWAQSRRARASIPTSRPGPEQRLDLRHGQRSRSGTLPPPLIKARYGEPVLTRIYNNTAGRPRRTKRRLRPQRAAAALP